VGVIKRAARCAMLHSFYTGIEKILKLIAREWHRELLKQMSAATATRPAVLSPVLVEVLGEFLAFRHLFRGASIVLMRWDKLSPLVAKVASTYDQTESEITAFLRFIEAGSSLRAGTPSGWTFPDACQTARPLKRRSRMAGKPSSTVWRCSRSRVERSKSAIEAAQWRQRLPGTRYSKLTKQAEIEGVSMNSLVTAIIAEGAR